MHWWAISNNYKALKIAITKAGANVDVLDGSGKTPLFHSAGESPAYKATQILIEFGANVNAYVIIGTPLDDAQGARNKKLLKDAGVMTLAQIKKKFKLPNRERIEEAAKEDSEYYELLSKSLEEYSKLVNDALKKQKDK